MNPVVVRDFAKKNIFDKCFNYTIFLIFLGLCATAQVPSVSGNATAADVSASRYDAIASLDEAQYNEEERWRDRTELITKYDHEEYQSYAQGIIHEVVDTLVIVE